MSTPLAEVVDALEAAGLPVALIGAAALALHGAPRSSDDTDLATIGAAALDAPTWGRLVAAGADVERTRGDADDPLAGVVRVSHAGSAIDVVVFRGATWQSEVLARAERMLVDGAHVPVVTAAGLVLLKLFAGGMHDRQDVLALLAIHGDALRASVDAQIDALPADAGRLWRELRPPA